MPRISQVSIEAPIAPDMTPMIDVTFQLIIFFMCINTMSELERMATLKLPVAAMASIEQPDLNRMIVNIEKDGTVKVYDRTVDMAELEHLLAVYKRTGCATFRSGDAPIVLRGDKDCPYQDVKGVLAAIYGTGYEKILFAAYMRDEEEP